MNKKFYLYLLSFLPLLIYFLFFNTLNQFFWFGDDFYLLSQLKSLGLRDWIFHPFVENYCPAFKVIWYYLLKITDYNYQLILPVLFLSHGVIIFLIILNLKALKVSNYLIFLSLVPYALSWLNKNVILFSYHLTASLSFIFLLLASFILIREHKFKNNYLFFLAILCLILSNLSFARGFVFSISLAVTYFLSTAYLGKAYKLRSLIIFLTAFVSFLSTYYFVPDRVSDFFPGNILEAKKMTTYFLSSFFANPLYQIVSIYNDRAPELSFLLSLALLKFGVLFLAIFLYRKEKKILMLIGFLLLIEIFSSLLLAVGRYQEGFVSSFALRYQRVYLLAFCFCFALGVIKIFKSNKYASTLIVLAFSILMFLPWQSQLNNEHQVFQGKYFRQYIFNKTLPTDKVQSQKLSNMLNHLVPIKTIRDVSKTYQLKPIADLVPNLEPKSEPIE